MFEPQTYAEKRAALNEILLQQLVGVVLRNADATVKGHMGQMLESYGRAQQMLRDGAAEEILGKFEPLDGVEYATAQDILDYLKANVGRTYFGTEEQTAAPDGSIGTAGFSLKFKDWLTSLPAYDTSVSKDMQSGFYRDEMTQGPHAPLPILVIRHDSELITVLFRMYVSVMVLNLDHIPADYKWGQLHHYALRGEMYSYRGNLPKSDLEAQFTAALAGQGIDTLHQPVIETATVGLSQTEDKAPTSDETAGQSVAEATPAE